MGRRRDESCETAKNVAGFISIFVGVMIYALILFVIYQATFSQCENIVSDSGNVFTCNIDGGVGSMFSFVVIMATLSLIFGIGASYTTYYTLVE